MSEAPWFFVPPEQWGEELSLSAEESHHALRVLRVSPPDIITVTDGAGRVARCSIEKTDGGIVRARLLEAETHRRPPPQIAVYQGLAKGRKVDEVVDGLAELGVAETFVYVSERAVVRWDRAKVDHHLDRWRSVARAAAKQSRSPFVLQVGGGLSWAELVGRIAREPLAIVLWEEASLPLRAVLVDGVERIALVVGPEGGLAAHEAEALADAGAQLASLGPRILRTELAPIAACAALGWHYGTIG